MTMAAPIESLLNEIRESEDPIEELKSLRTAVYASPVSGLRPAALDPIQLAENYKTALQSGLNHTDDSVKVLALTQAIATLLKLSQTKAGLDALFRSDLLNKLKDVMLASDVIRYRVYELVVEASSASPVSLGYCANSGLISQMLGELIGDDVLIRATAIEMVSSLAQSQHGRQHLAQQGVMDQISNMIIAAESDPFSSLYLPGESQITLTASSSLVKFFGSLAIVESPQQVCEKYPVFLEVVFSMVMNLEPTLTPVALDTLGVLGGTVEGKQKFLSVLKQMSAVVSDGATELRVRCLEALAQLLTLPVEQQTEDLLLLTESWFKSLSPEPLGMIQSISTQPFAELHCSALRILIAIGSQPWAQEQMARTPGFMEWVLDRSAGKGKQVKECKFELVAALLSCSRVQQIFGSNTYLKLRSYLSEGPYYVHAVSSVTTEGAD
ncbi:hypothetical protein DNTS_004673 [Danionella cerebrum]|uniref:26S proteasome non-ATPase regulatory subunit 5 n=1 Tax=Danionella cerebrum TaxID=2873325 RepID=A0A553QZ31_9TELE|nr:hypothetical protein DNTS_004673 [Danionella translucida]